MCVLKLVPPEVATLREPGVYIHKRRFASLRLGVNLALNVHEIGTKIATGSAYQSIRHQKGGGK